MTRQASMAAHPAGKNSFRARKRSTFIIRYDAIITVIVASAVAFVLGMACQWQVTQLAEKNSFESVGWCTDAIADAGGTCHGEPLPPCVTEDSANCYWDAASRGNGLGQSFVDVDGIVYYQEVAP
jgi:hypothetical protein